jgi:hypothetical protein
MITSKDSIFQRPYFKQNPDHFSRARHVLQGNAPRSISSDKMALSVAGI